jgi:hypothetical protein
MKWFHLRSDSIGALAGFMLSLVIALYLLSIRNKSRDSWHITGLFIFYVFIHAMGFIADSITATSWYKYVLKFQEFILSSSIIYTLWIFYVYRQNPFDREMRLVLKCKRAFVGNGLLF